MDTRVALVGIIVENMDSTPELNKLLHEYGSYIIGWVCHTVSGMCISSALQSMRRRMLSMHFPGKSADLMESRQRRCIRMLAWHKLAWI